MTKLTDIPEVTQVPVRRLLLDAENPRLSGDDQTMSQDDLVRRLWSEMAVDEVALSIAANGYFQTEPLLAVRKRPLARDPEDQDYIVIEGNRRLAAVRLLLSDELSKLAGADLPAITPSRRQELQKLPVSPFDKREDLWEYLGFRHINGPKPWDAFAKARYVAKVRDEYDIPLEEIARRIGDRHATVRRLYRGFQLLRQAEAKLDFDQEDVAKRRFYFSHLYTAADQPEFQEFLGITPLGSLKKNPVRKDHLPELGELLLWLYGSRALHKPALVQTQNPDLNKLRAIISTKHGLAALRAGVGLERAGEISIGDERRFRDALVRGKDDLQQAKATVTTGYKGDPELLETAEEILDVAVSVKEEMDRRVKKRMSKARA